MNGSLDAVPLLEDLVRIESVNPELESGGPGEREVGRYLAGVLRDLGLEVFTPEVMDGRFNVVSILPGAPDGPSLLLETHLDTVALPPGGLQARRSGERMIGRGACDAKGCLAAMVAAMSRLASTKGRWPTVLLAGVIDEERGMQGARALLEQIPKVDAAVVGEPTSLVPIRAHNGCLRVTLTTRGRAAHTSRADLGENAIVAAARVVVELESGLGSELARRPHVLVGHAFLTPAMIRGGVADNIVPDRCEVRLDRRIAPGEAPSDVLAELDAFLKRLRAEGIPVSRNDPSLLLPGVETPDAHRLVRASEEAVESVIGEQRKAQGAPYTTDAARLAGEGGIPSVVLGPGSIDQAHTDEEWVPLAEVQAAVDVYVEVVRRFGKGTST